MNLADAIRQASGDPRPTPPAPPAPIQVVHAAVPREPESAPPVTESVAEPDEALRTAPEPIAPPAYAGNMVRLELFLSSEQLNGVLRSVMSVQHSVMTLREAAAYLRTPMGTVERMAQEGTIPAFSIEGRWRFPKHALDEWLTMRSVRGVEGTPDAP